MFLVVTVGVEMLDLGLPNKGNVSGSHGRHLWVPGVGISQRTQTWTAWIWHGWEGILGSNEPQNKAYGIPITLRSK